MKKIFLVMIVCLGLCCGCDNNRDKYNKDGTVTYEYAKELVINENAKIIDVRTDKEYREDHIDGAVLFDLDTINKDNASVLIDNKEAYVIVYCKSGNRSKKALKLLNDLGYENVYDLGAISNWKD